MDHGGITTANWDQLIRVQPRSSENWDWKQPCRPLHKNYWSNFHQTWMEDQSRPRTNSLTKDADLNEGMDPELKKKNSLTLRKNTFFNILLISKTMHGYLLSKLGHYLWTSAETECWDLMEVYALLSAILVCLYSKQLNFWYFLTHYPF